MVLVGWVSKPCLGRYAKVLVVRMLKSNPKRGVIFRIEKLTFYRNESILLMSIYQNLFWLVYTCHIDSTQLVRHNHVEQYLAYLDPYSDTNLLLKYQQSQYDHSQIIIHIQMIAFWCYLSILAEMT